MFRFCYLLICFWVPCTSLASPAETEVGPIPPAEVQHRLVQLLERSIRSQELVVIGHDTLNSTPHVSWYDDLFRWLLIHNRSDRFDDSQNRTWLQELGFINLETYRINDEPKRFALKPFSSPNSPILRQLPGVGLDDAVRFVLNIDASTQVRHLALTTQSPHHLELNGTPLKPVFKSPYYCLDNHGYTLPPISSTDRLAVVMKVNHGYRSVAARVFNHPPIERKIFYDWIVTQQTQSTPSWLSVLWASFHSDQTQTQKQLPWLREQLDTDTPWRYAFILHKHDKLEQWLPQFNPIPDPRNEREWWRSLTFNAGQTAIRTGRLRAAYQRIQSLNQAQDSDSKRAGIELMAALLDDAGLHFKASQLLEPFASDLNILRQQHVYLANGELFTQSAALLARIAASPSCTRSDMYAFISNLYRSGKTEHFRQTRIQALIQCPSCWRSFGVTGEDVLPALDPKALKVLLKTPGFEAFEQFNDVNRIVSHRRSPTTTVPDTFFDRAAPIANVQRDAPIRNVRIAQHVQLNENGLSSVRVRRLVAVSGQLTNDTMSFTMDYVPDRQFIQIHRALLKRNGVGDRSPTETDESTDQPKARLYYDARRRRLTFSDLRPGDRIELDWSVVDHSPDTELPGLDGWVFPLSEQWPTDESSITWHSEKGALIAQLSEDKSLLEGNSVYQQNLPGNQNMNESTSEFLMLSMLSTWTMLDRLYTQGIEDRYAPNEFIAKTAAEIVSGETDPKKQLALLFSAVQQKVHYVGLELGDHSRTPEWAENVWRRGLGDCKDKAALLIALAKTVGIELSFALIRTRLLPKLKHGLPTLSLFDHAAVYAPQWNVFMDPNQPNLGLEVLPALIQGAQAFVLGSSKKLTNIPINGLKHERVEWTFTHTDPSTNTWQTNLEISGHASTPILDSAVLDESHMQQLSGVIARFLPGWNIKRINLTRTDLNRSSVGLTIDLQPINTDLNVVLTSLIQTPAAWYTQSESALFANHDLPRSFKLKMPMAKTWSSRQKGHIKVPGGRIILAPVRSGEDWYLHLTAELVDPSAFTDADKNTLLIRIFKHLRGSQ